MFFSLKRIINIYIYFVKFCECVRKNRQLNVLSTSDDNICSFIRCVVRSNPNIVDTIPTSITFFFIMTRNIFIQFDYYLSMGKQTETDVFCIFGYSSLNSSFQLKIQFQKFERLKQMLGYIHFVRVLPIKRIQFLKFENTNGILNTLPNSTLYSIRNNVFIINYSILVSIFVKLFDFNIHIQNVIFSAQFSVFFSLWNIEIIRVFCSFKCTNTNVD